MATGNFILNGSRKSVGSVTTYRRNGKQVVRAKATAVSNPKTASQSNQRALFAPAAKFYAPLAVTLEQSFEGKSKSESYAAFLKKAIDDSKRNGWYLPKGSAFTPLPYQLTQGTVQPLSFTAGVDGINLILGGTGGGDLTTIGELSKVFIDNGYSVGDQVTFILILSDSSNTSLSNNFWPIAGRFILAPESTVLISEELPMFAIEDARPDVIVTTTSGFDMVGGAVIVSRYENNKWRRSTQRLAVADWIVEQLTSADSRDLAIESYMNGATEVTSDVYLNGSTGESGAATVQTIAMDDGTAFTPRNIQYSNGIAEVGGTTGAGAVTYVNVKIGADYLITANSKGAAPQDVQLMRHYIDGTNAAVKNWLQTNGVASSVF